MAIWKKLVYSGSNAHLNQVTGSMSGSFVGNGSGLTGIILPDLNTFTGSANNRFSSLELTTGSLNLFTASIQSEVNNLKTATGSLNNRFNSIEQTTGSLNTFSGSVNSRLSSIELTTGSYATTGSNTFIGTEIISGSVNITGSLSVIGTTSGSFVGNGSGLTGIVATANPAGQNQSVQFNDAGATSGSYDLLFNKATGQLSGSYIGNGSGLTGLNKSIGLTIDGGGSVITTGIKGDITIPFNGTITGWYLTADQVGSIVIDVWKDVLANFPPTVLDTIAGSEKPTLSGVSFNSDTSLTVFTGSISTGDVIRFNVDSVATVTRVNLVLTATTR